MLIACSAGDDRQNTSTSIGVDDDGTSAADDAGPTTATMTTTTTASSTDATDDGTEGTDDGVDTTDGSGTEGPAVSCDDDPAACDAWFLPRDAASWEAVTLGGPAALAPGSAVLAAFDIEAEQIAFVVTQDDVVQVDLETRSWVAKTAVADRLPQINAPVLAAYSIPAYWSGIPDSPEGVTIAGSDVAFLYAYDTATGEFTYDQSTALGAEWDEPGAPAGTEVRAMWLDVTNADGWVDNDLGELCEQSGPVGPYLAVVTADAVHPMDVGTCFGFFPGVAYGEFAPTALPGAPPADRIGGAAYNETTGLVVFAGD